MLDRPPRRTSLMKVALVTLMIVGMGVEAAPMERGSSLAHTEHHKVSLALKQSQYLKRWLRNARQDGPDATTRTTDKTTAKTTTTSHRAERHVRVNAKTDGPDKQEQIMKMISALQELHRTINSTLSSRITIRPRANGRNSVKKNKVLPVSEGTVKPTTVPPADVDSTASRASDDIIIPSSLTGRNFKKSLPPQPKKTNKRVCFWKYCSQN